MDADHAEEYSLKWNSHNSELVAEFGELVRDEIFTDVTIAADEMTFEAHKLILSACSPYFKSLLVAAAKKCAHPVIFLKDVSASHVALLLRYMYSGEILVKKEDLTSFLKSADHLRIRGLAMTKSTTNNSPPPQHRSDVVLMSHVDDEEEEKRKNIITATTKGRKGYLPKKIRTSGDRISDSSSSPRQCMSEPGMHPGSPGSGSSGSGQLQGQHQRNNSGALPTIMETCQNFDNATNNNAKDNDNGMEPLQMDIMDNEGTEPTTEEEEDQPVDLTGGNSLIGLTGMAQPRYSILNSYLKSGKLGQKMIGKPQNSIVDENEAASISKAAESLAATWLEQSLTAMQSNDEDEKEKRETIPLQETLGIDIADRLRSHFLSNLPAQSYNWLNNGTSPNNKAIAQNGNGNGGAPRTTTTTTTSLTGKPSVTCEICGKKLADPSSLYRHRKIHSGDKPHKCPYCTRRFIQRYNMKQHIKTHRMERMTDAEKAEYLPRPRQPQNV